MLGSVSLGQLPEGGRAWCSPDKPLGVGGSAQLVGPQEGNDLEHLRCDHEAQLWQEETSPAGNTSCDTAVKEVAMRKVCSSQACNALQGPVLNPP